MRIYSEIPTGRTQELVADGATAVWVFLWTWIGVQVYSALSELAVVGTTIGDAGDGIESAGNTLEGALEQVPVVGAGAGDLIGGAFEGVSGPLIQAGADLERLLLIIAAVLGLLLVAVALIPWLNRYLPWRRARWQRLNAASRVIRRTPAGGTPAVPAAEMERVLATRAMYRLEYVDLLEHTPDPIGDFTAGRHDRLARAELTSAGLVRIGSEAG